MMILDSMGHLYSDTSAEKIEETLDRSAFVQVRNVLRALELGEALVESTPFILKSNADGTGKRAAPIVMTSGVEANVPGWVTPGQAQLGPGVVLTWTPRVEGDLVKAGWAEAVGGVRAKLTSAVLDVTKGHYVKWTPEMDALLGVVSDEKLAKQLNIHRQTVARRRLELGIETDCNRSPISWTPRMDALLGTMPDSKLAKCFGITHATVGQRRKKLGVDNGFGNTKVVWTPEMDALLGVVSDPKLAQQFGVSQGAVWKRRLELGIEAGFKNRHITWTPRMDALLGTISDVKLAKQFSANVATVLRRRQEIGIEAGFKNNPTSWNPEMDALLGVVSDYKLAKQFDISRKTVIKRRRELGIPPFNSDNSKEKEE